MIQDDPELVAFYRQLGANVRAQRKRLGLSQDALAHLVGLTRTSLTNIEHGRQHPPLHTFCDIVEHLDAHAPDLLPRRNGAAAASIEAPADKPVRGKITATLHENGAGTRAASLPLRASRPR